mmetsp:Transcript_32071/g.54340  ORF Transcript_32071/g.54340 Transcript_32071/m.54340 type:complete len:174 (-) Transcript_32071:719-1240(-)
MTLPPFPLADLERMLVVKIVGRSKKMTITTSVGVRVFATPNMPKDSGRLWAWNRSSHHLSEFWGRLALSVDTIYHRRFWADNLLKYELHLHINCLRSSNSRRMLSPFFGHFSSFPPPSLLPLPLSLMTTEKKLVPQMGKVDVLLTHSPPRGVLDRCWSNQLRTHTHTHTHTHT